jgi:hypothetical protein
VKNLRLRDVGRTSTQVTELGRDGIESQMCMVLIVL